ncbi:hypothetical protein A0H76_2893 [Hepatospora eriocheir]|uniref:Uncharacterized protein n=1 Tax=Hepatospora eriocheir TaxID=1081669 RepID=A0A1X0Q5S0_9MICR|nr:hypothetical protein A0H76_2893 [Hepatospora eriocheir]
MVKQKNYVRKFYHNFFIKFLKKLQPMNKRLKLIITVFLLSDNNKKYIIFKQYINETYFHSRS